MAKNLVFKTYKRQIIVGIVALVLIGTVVVTGLVSSRQADQHAAIDNQEMAYSNIIKDSLNVYHARYAKYPDTYKTLLGDIDKSRDVYGVNDEGMSELTNVSARLQNFSYSPTSQDSGYVFTYTQANNGKTTTIKNE